MSDPLLRVSALSKHYTRNRRTVTAVDAISFEIAAGEIFALCGPSGSGKSTVARLVMRLLQPDSGAIVFGGRNLLQMQDDELRVMRPQFQMVFQDVNSSFNPRTTVHRALDDPLRIARRLGAAERNVLIDELLEQVELPPALAVRAIHEVSGGQRQRIAIARALAANPSLIVMDEALSAIDSSNRKEVLHLLLNLRDERGIAFLFISHDLALVRAIADRVAIMEHGRIVETGPARELISNPQSAIGRTLVAATPRLAYKTDVSP